MSLGQIHESLRIPGELISREPIHAAIATIAMLHFHVSWSTASMVSQEPKKLNISIFLHYIQLQMCLK